LRRQAIAASGLTPLEFLLSVMRDVEVHMDYRIKAAHAAASYCHRKMPVAIESGDANQPVVFDAAALAELTTEEKTTLLELFDKMMLSRSLPKLAIEGSAEGTC
jgi:hypothetical protein